ncbi:hypothetical protein [Desulfatibacillum aliphaticivorans]|uniref:hypothetical protein n=1 Tax=Desulfatibacillum aliphaticivorans TaxID=218208 RepID=UPI00040E5AAE|nr:hypothetical protein [Desulfatibacillum aliphaticivorans]
METSKALFRVLDGSRTDFTLADGSQVECGHSASKAGPDLVWIEAAPEAIAALAADPRFELIENKGNVPWEDCE